MVVDPTDSTYPKSAPGNRSGFLLYHFTLCQKKKQNKKKIGVIA